MKNTRYHNLRVIIFGGLAIFVASLSYYFILSKSSLVIDFSTELSLELGGVTLLGIAMIFLFDLQIILFELMNDWKSTVKKPTKS